MSQNLAPMLYPQISCWQLAAFPTFILPVIEIKKRSGTASFNNWCSKSYGGDTGQNDLAGSIHRGTGQGRGLVQNHRI